MKPSLQRKEQSKAWTNLLNKITLIATFMFWFGMYHARCLAPSVITRTVEACTSTSAIAESETNQRLKLMQEQVEGQLTLAKKELKDRAKTYRY